MLSPFVPTSLPTMGQLPGPSLDIWNWGRQRAARRDNNLLSIFRCRPGLDRAGGRSPGEAVPGPPRAADNVGSDGEEAFQSVLFLLTPSPPHLAPAQGEAPAPPPATQAPAPGGLGTGHILDLRGKV